jgi:hypothetical protein
LVLIHLGDKINFKMIHFEVVPTISRASFIASFSDFFLADLLTISLTLS